MFVPTYPIRAAVDVTYDSSTANRRIDGAVLIDKIRSTQYPGGSRPALCSNRFHGGDLSQQMQVGRHWSGVGEVGVFTLPDNPVGRKVDKLPPKAFRF